MRREILPLLLLALAAFWQASPTPVHAWSLEPVGIQPHPLLSPIIPTSPPSRADFKGDGALETLTLAGGRAALRSGQVVLWQSPATWQVTQIAIADLEHIGRPQAALLVWRPFQLWPVDLWLPHGGRIQNFHDASGQSCHLILIGWRRDAYTTLWAGSALADPIHSFAAADLNGDGEQELITLEGAYPDPRSAPAHTLKVWEWNGFGFTAVDSREGVFAHLVVGQETNGRLLILSP